MSGPRICEVGGAGNGLIFPAFGDDEAEWPQALKAILYFMGLCWCFLGVAMVSDVFMSAIEAITSVKRRVLDKGTGRYRTVKVWNDTVANLTLMALGSSAPEILLNIIEVGKNKMFAGDLGPGTIVGSAAFNLLCIAAVCVIAIPQGEVRCIKDVHVYAVTAVFSLWAYAWLLIILIASSPDVVDIWEAVVTLLMFPVLVMIAFGADKGWIGGVPAVANRRRIVAAEMTKEELAELISKIKQEFGDIDDDTVRVLVEKRTAARPSKAAYRVETNSRRKNKLRGNTMGSTESMTMTGSWANANAAKTTDLAKKKDPNGNTLRSSASCPFVDNQAVVEFATSAYAVKESGKMVTVEVKRFDEMSIPVSVRYRTKEGTAESDKDYVHTEGIIEFAPQCESQSINVKILDDNEWEKAEDFYVELFDPQTQSDTGSVIIGPNHLTTVTIIDDDDPGELAFEKELVEITEDVADISCRVGVVRIHGSKGDIKCKYKTEDGTAIKAMDYEAVEGVFALKDGECSGEITLSIKARGRYESSEYFRLIMYDAEGCRFDASTDGNEEQNICTIQIMADDAQKTQIDKLAVSLAVNWDKARLGASNWKEQILEAIYVNGDPEGYKEASAFDWFFHIVSFPWRLAFSLIPPPDFANGWWCFSISLVMIGLVTAIIGDLASLFGCALDVMPPEVVAITFVALGTSLPDTFASKSAAQQDPYADASITNITGSNSVNVFLGLGLPWTIASVYWAANGYTQEWYDEAPQNIRNEYPDGGVYVVVGGALGFSVGVFTACAIAAMACLWMRRVLFKGELGGPSAPKWATFVFLVALWFGYVAASWIYIEVSD